MSLSPPCKICGVIEINEAAFRQHIRDYHPAARFEAPTEDAETRIKAARAIAQRELDRETKQGYPCRTLQAILDALEDKP